ncbi:MAG: hypothetical protein IT508_08905, partial [Burkholderiaceae bacterium]|nr:hypothetical protein [Burkholderiaceae bacterium]
MSSISTPPPGMLPAAGPPAAPARARPALAGALRWLVRGALVLAVLMVTAYLTVRHYVWPQLDRWRPAIERQLSQAVGVPVSFGKLVTGFDGLRPWLVAQGVSIDDADGQRAFSADRVRAVLSLRSLVSGRPRLALLEVQAPVLRIERLAAGQRTQGEHGAHAAGGQCGAAVRIRDADLVRDQPGPQPGET